MTAFQACTLLAPPFSWSITFYPPQHYSANSVGELLWKVFCEAASKSGKVKEGCNLVEKLTQREVDNITRSEVDNSSREADESRGEGQKEGQESPLLLSSSSSSGSSSSSSNSTSSTSSSTSSSSSSTQVAARWSLIRPKGGYNQLV